MQVFPVSHSSLVTSTCLGKSPFLQTLCQSQILGSFGRSQRSGWQQRMGPVEWGSSSAHTKHLMELGLDFLMDSKGFNTFTSSCPSLAALLVCSPGSSSFIPAYFCILQNRRDTKMLKLWECLCCTLSINLLAHNLTLTGSEIPWCGSQPAGLGWCRCV